MDIDKIYAIMASLNRNGIYDEYENGNLNIINFNNSPVVDISTISDIELELYENLLELVNYVNDKNYNSVLLSFTDKVKSLLIENDITLDKNILYSVQSNGLLNISDNKILIEFSSILVSGKP